MKSKKLISIFLVLAMLISIAIPALVIGEDETAGEITVEEANIELTEELEPEVTAADEPAERFGYSAAGRRCRGRHRVHADPG